MTLPASNVANTNPDDSPDQGVQARAWPLPPASVNAAHYELSKSPSWRGRMVCGVALVFIGVAATCAALFSVQANNLSQMVAPVLAILALSIAIYEGVGLLRKGGCRISNLGLYPAASVILVSCALSLNLFSTSGEMQRGLLPNSWILGDAPILCGIFLLLRGFALRAEQRIGRRNALLFPQEGEDLVPVKSSDTISLCENQVVPADVRIESGSVAVLERYLSPMPTFRIKDETESVLAGSTVLSGGAQAVALSGVEDSCLRRFEDIVTPHVEATERAIIDSDQGLMAGFAQTVAFLAAAAAIFWSKSGGSASDVLLASGLILFAGAGGYLIEIVHSAGCGFVRTLARAGFVSTDPMSLKELSKISSVVFDPSRIEAESSCRVRELEILDDRIGREELCSCLASLLGRSDDPALVAAGDYCQRVLGRVVVDRVLDLREYRGRGVSGAVKGVEISIGTEDFIVERGIMLQPSELATTSVNERVFLVALGTNVIARFWIDLGQSSLVSESSGQVWPRGVHAVAATGVKGELKDDTLLVRGRESEVLGRSARLEVARSSHDRIELPKATLVAITDRLDDLPELLRGLAVQQRRLSKVKFLAAASALVCIAAGFTGLFSALIPAAVFGVVGVFLSPGR